MEHSDVQNNPPAPSRRAGLQLLAAALAVLCLVVALPLLFFGGVTWFNTPSATRYPVRGVDVSRYQGDIDWPTLAAQDIHFAFIKATEGSSNVDARFAENLAAALQTPLRVGAYHFFSYDSPGDTQADNFVATVPIVAGMLPPVVDVEFYGGYAQHPPDAREVQPQLDVFVQRLHQHYGCAPILYATQRAYDLYLADRYPDCDIWIRDVVAQPRLSDGRDWVFWQYTNRQRLPGYSGEEEFIDMNVFYGDLATWQAYAAVEEN